MMKTSKRQGETRREYQSTCRVSENKRDRVPVESVNGAHAARLGTHIGGSGENWRCQFAVSSFLTGSNTSVFTLSQKTYGTLSAMETEGCACILTLDGTEAWPLLIDIPPQGIFSHGQVLVLHQSRFQTAPSRHAKCHSSVQDEQFVSFHSYSVSPMLGDWFVVSIIPGKLH
jgi:hypothetical protein